jgi:hypothetical protein
MEIFAEISVEWPALTFVLAVLVVLVYVWPRVGRAQRWTALSLALIAALSLAHQAIFRTLAADAFITFRYALNFATGKRIVFNPGERVEGYPNFLFLVLLAALKRFGGADIFTAARVVGVAVSVATIIVTYRLARRLTSGDRHGGLIAALLVAASGCFAAWGPSGMETTVFALLATLIALAVISEHWLWAGPLIGLATMTRPDGILFLLLAGFFTRSSATPRCGSASAPCCAFQFQWWACSGPLPST